MQGNTESADDAGAASELSALQNRLAQLQQLKQQLEAQVVLATENETDGKFGWLLKPLLY